jgi:hypothetical protein
MLQIRVKAASLLCRRGAIPSDGETRRARVNRVDVPDRLVKLIIRICLDLAKTFPNPRMSVRRR